MQPNGEILTACGGAGVGEGVLFLKGPKCLKQIFKSLRQKIFIHVYGEYFLRRIA